MRKLSMPEGPLRRNIEGRYRNYNSYSKYYNSLDVYDIRFTMDNGKYRGTFTLKHMQSHVTNGVVSYSEGEYFEPITSASEIIFRSSVKVRCHAHRLGEFNKKITEWKDDEFSEPHCATEEEIRLMNEARKDVETSGAYFRLVGDDELWLGDEDRPVKLRKVPAKYIEVID